MKTLYKIWSIILLFRAGFIHSGYSKKYTLNGRIYYAYVYTRRWIKAGAGDLRAWHAEKHYRQLRRRYKRESSGTS